MYYMFMGDMQIPIPPPELVTSIQNRNKTINLLGAGEVNILKDVGLTQIGFTMMLPNSKYPFNQSLLFKSKKAPYYLDKLEKFKVEKKPFQFIVVRMKDSGEFINLTNMKVTLEDYTVKESASEGYDFQVAVKLKMYKDFGAKKISLQAKDGTMTGKVESPRASDKVPKTDVKSKGGLTLAQTMKKELGNTNNIFSVAKLNKIAVPAALAAGQVIKLKG